MDTGNTPKLDIEDLMTVRGPTFDCILEGTATSSIPRIKVIVYLAFLGMQNRFENESQHENRGISFFAALI